MSLYVLSHITTWTQGRPLLPALCISGRFLTIPLSIEQPGVEFHRELRESIWILLGGVCKSLWILLYSVCVKHLTVSVYRGRISFRFARIKIDFKVSVITHFNGEIDSHISGCYENHCENRFSDSRRISSPGLV